MIFDIIYSPEAQEDLADIYNHISVQFKSPETAKAQVKRIRDKADSLIVSPKRYRVYRKSAWRGLSLRLCPVNNYSILYVVDEQNEFVRIARIVCGRRNLDAIFINPNN